MNKPESIIADLVRKMTNAKNGNHSIKDWMAMMSSKKKTSSSNNLLNEIERSNEEEKDKFNVNKKINIDITKVNDDDNLLGDLIEEDDFEDLDNLVVEDSMQMDDYLVV
jgi:hypothetical protein